MIISRKSKLITTSAGLIGQQWDVDATKLIINTSTKLNVHARGWTISLVTEWHKHRFEPQEPVKCWKASPTRFYKQTKRPQPHKSKMWTRWQRDCWRAMPTEMADCIWQSDQTELSWLTDHSCLRDNQRKLNCSQKLIQRQPATAKLFSEITMTVVWVGIHKTLDKSGCKESYLLREGGYFLDKRFEGGRGLSRGGLSYRVQRRASIEGLHAQLC